MLRRQFFLFALAQTVPDRPLVVFAAASLTNVLTRLGAPGHAAPTLVFDASSRLARQIDAGAPADIFMSADEAWMNYLETRHDLLAGTRRDVAGNQLVLIGARGAPGLGAALGPASDLIARLGPDGRLAIADPSSVPAGLYARQALQALSRWTSLAPRLLPTQDVRAALARVEQGDCPLGIVYATDARASAKVQILATFDDASHDKIRYPAAVTARSTQPEAARRYLDFLAAPDSVGIWQQFGFSAP